MFLPGSHAACQFPLTDFDSQRILPWQHSIQHEGTFLSPFTAVLSAWKLRWNVLSDYFLVGCEGSLDSTHDGPVFQFQERIPNRQPSILAAYDVTPVEKSESRAVDAPCDRQVMLRSSIRCSRKFSRDSAKTHDHKQVKFHSEISILMAVSFVPHEILHQ